MNSQELRMLLILGALALSGCSAVAGRLGYVKQNVGEHSHVASVAATADEANIARPTFEDSVRHKIGLNVDYDLQVGTPQIDVASMQVALGRYETQMIAFNQQAEAVRKRNELNLKLATEYQVRQILDEPNGAVHVGFLSGENGTAGTHAQRKVPGMLHPEQPTLADLQLMVPIRLKIGGDGSLEDTVARRSTKVERQLLTSPLNAGRADDSSAALIRSQSSRSESGDSFVDDVPSFEDETDEPPFDDSVPDVLLLQELDGTDKAQETIKH